jgi:hypothetical protein
VLLGTGRDGQPVFVDYSALDRFICLFSAPQGTGKSVFLAWLTYYFNVAQNAGVILFDVADEYKAHREPLTDKLGLKRIERMSLRPDSWDNLLRLKPIGLCREDDDTDVKFSVTLDDIKQFGTEQYEFLLGAAMGSQGTPAQALAIGHLAQQDCRDVASMVAAWRAYKETMRAEGEGGSVAHISKLLTNLVNYSIFGKKAEAFPFVDALNDKCILAMLGNPDGSQSSSRAYSFYASYISTLLYYASMDGALQDPVLVIRDELSGFASFPEGAAIIRKETNVQRKAGNHSVQATQFISQIPHDTLLPMLATGFFICGKPLPLTLIERVAETKNVDAQALQMAIEGLDNTQRPSELLCVTHKGELIPFSPPSTPSQYLMSKKIEEW